MIQGTSKTMETEAKEQEGEFFGMLLGTLCASLLRNLLPGKFKIIEVKARLELVRVFNAVSSFN